MASVQKSESELTSYRQLVATNQLEVRVLTDPRTPDWVLTGGTWHNDKTWKRNEFWINNP